MSIARPPDQVDVPPLGDRASRADARPKAGSAFQGEIAASRAASGRFWLGILIGGLVAIPFCWLLSFAGLLPFFLGVFFFALFGLVIGAVVFRVAHPAAPYHPTAVLFGTTLLVALVWLASIFKESRDAPGDLAEKALRGTRDLRGKSVDDFREEVAAEIRRLIASRYPPGGSVGYVRWALAGGRIAKGDLKAASVELTLGQGRYLFAIRVALSIGLLAFGIASQTWPLRRKAGAADAAAETPPSPT